MKAVQEFKVKIGTLEHTIFLSENGKYEISHGIGSKPISKKEAEKLIQEAIDEKEKIEAIELMREKNKKNAVQNLEDEQEHYIVFLSKFIGELLIQKIITPTQKNEIQTYLQNELKKKNEKNK